MNQEEVTHERFNQMFKRISDIMMLIFHNTSEKIAKKFGYFEIFGFDFMLDSKLNPYLLEINSNPALFTGTTVQKQILPPLIENVYNVNKLSRFSNLFLKFMKINQKVKHLIS